MIVLWLGLGYWFWGLFILEFCLLTFFVEEEWAWPSLASIIVFLFAIWWLADIPVWTWIKDNPITLLKYCGYYIVIGLAWSFGKYFFILLRIRKTLKQIRVDWEQNKKALQEKHKTFKDFALANNYYGDKNDPRFEQNTKNLVFWAAFWPSSMVWTLLNDLVRKLFRFLIHDVFISAYRKLHKAMVGKLLED